MHLLNFFVYLTEKYLKAKWFKYILFKKINFAKLYVWHVASPLQYFNLSICCHMGAKHFLGVKINVYITGDLFLQCLLKKKLTCHCFYKINKQKITKELHWLFIFSWFIACNYLFTCLSNSFLVTRCLLDWEILEGYTPLFLQ